jgi:endogenous inhibitor of DNA gyrase (YacG/DUF329 family)
MEPAPNVEQVFFPLDEELGLLPGNLAPRQQEHVAHLASWMPFDKAVQMIEEILGVQTNQETVRQLTERMGAYMETAQVAESETGCSQEAEKQPVPQRCALSADGAMVSLLNKQWAEIRTVAIGEPQEKRNTDGEREIHVGKLSYFSRLADAFSFTHLAHVEVQRRQVGQAKDVCAVMDGADWLQFFTERHRPDAVRILDFPHAAEHVTKLLETLEQAGMRFPPQMLQRCLHVLKHRGPRCLLRMADRLDRALAQQKGVQEHLDYLRKREALMCYPAFQRQGWPIGSGMVESANKNVVEARLKGTGMHWERKQVNPMLALRNAVCNDRWKEMWQEALKHSGRQQASRRAARAFERRQALLTADTLSSPASPPLPSAATRSLSSSPSLLPASKARLAVTPPRSSRPFSEGKGHNLSKQVGSSHQRAPQMKADVCLCGTPLVRFKDHQSKKYCSDRCRQHAYRERQRQSPQLSLPVAVTMRGNLSSQQSTEMSVERCPCGTPLVRFKGHRTKGYCSGRCRQRAYRERQRWGF